jgi:hypothetical protein
MFMHAILYSFCQKGGDIVKQNSRLPKVVRKDGIRKCEFRDEHQRATVTLKDGTAHQVALTFSRRYPHGVYRDASGRIFLIG